MNIDVAVSYIDTFLVTLNTLLCYFEHHMLRRFLMPDLKHQKHLNKVRYKKLRTNFHLCMQSSILVVS